MNPDKKKTAFRAVLKLDDLETESKQVYNQPQEGETLSRNNMLMPELIRQLGEQIAEANYARDQLEDKAKYVLAKLKDKFANEKDDKGKLTPLSKAELKALTAKEYIDARVEFLEAKKAVDYLKVKNGASQNFFEASRSRLSWIGRGL